MSLQPDMVDSRIGAEYDVRSGCDVFVRGLKMEECPPEVTTASLSAELYQAERSVLLGLPFSETHLDLHFQQFQLHLILSFLNNDHHLSSTRVLGRGTPTACCV